MKTRLISLLAVLALSPLARAADTLPTAIPL